MVRRREAPSDRDGMVLGGVVDDWFAERFPDLHHFLVDLAYDDSGQREPGSATLFRGESLPQACLSDKDAGMVAFVSGSSFARVLEALDTGLREDRLDWRRSRPKKR